jgi:hypothetical protein
MVRVYCAVREREYGSSVAIGTWAPTFVFEAVQGGGRGGGGGLPGAPCLARCPVRAKLTGVIRLGEPAPALPQTARAAQLSTGGVRLIGSQTASS